MTKQMNELIAELKEAGEDFEFYPTTRDIGNSKATTVPAIVVSEKFSTSAAANATSANGFTNSIEKQETVPWTSTNTLSSRRAIS